jgi:endonuclease-3
MIDKIKLRRPGLNIDFLISELRKKYRTGTFHFKDPFKVLVSVMLSQRTRDENTLKVTEKLFSVLKTPRQIAEVNEKKLQKLIKSSGFYRMKAKHLKETSLEIVNKYNGKVPDTLEELLTLPGVGRKTANCVLVFAFNKPAIPVDTHVHRISNRLGLVRTKVPEETEKGLMRTVPKKYWILINELLVKFGQDTCRPVNPKCSECGFNKICPAAFKDNRRRS